MAPEKNPDPVDALLELLRSGKLCQRVPATFFGSGTTFLAAVESHRGQEVMAHLGKIEENLKSWVSNSAIRAQRWEILKAVTAVRAGKAINAINTPGTFAAFDQDNQKVEWPHPEEENQYTPAINKLMLDSEGRRLEFAW